MTTQEGAGAVILRLSQDPATDAAKLKTLLEVRQTWEADEARKAFAAAMADFQTRCPIIAKGDKAYDKQYARIDRIHRETRDLRRECGFFFTWTICEIKGNEAHMEGMLGHSGGHTVAVKQVIPLPDVLKGQNATQRAGSAMTYAKRYAECLALDIVTGEDDDGACGITSGKPTNAAITEARELMAKVGRSEQAVCEYLKVERLEDATEAALAQAVSAMRTALRKRETGGAA